MLGLCGMILVLLKLICVMAYWIAWELRHKETRPTFRAQVWNDLVNLYGKCHASIRRLGRRAIVAKPVRGAPAQGRQSFEAPVLSRDGI